MDAFWNQTLNLGVVAILLVVVLFICYLAAGLIIEKSVNSRLESWREVELGRAKAELRNELVKEMEYEFKDWKSAYAGRIRQDAIARSKMVIAGKVAESVVPFLPEFAFNPKDARFLGSPVDYVIFDGLDEGELNEIVFLEVKTSYSKMSKRQRQIRDAIKEDRVSWQEIRITANQADLVIPEEEFDDIY